MIICSEEARKRGNAEARKRGSEEARKRENEEARKPSMKGRERERDGKISLF